ncbi:MAG: hypothetical protein KGR26_14285, partial [Cyanobacteria bacterium REEB65]|nr:hypothetical protein [Cyanobacteria bacterium REEB65]
MRRFEALEVVVVFPEVERYHSLVGEAKLSGAFFDEFVAKMRRAKITFGDRVSCHYLRPQMVSVEQYEQMRQVVRTLWSALEKLGAQMLRRPDLQDRVGLTAREKELVAIDPGYRRISPMARFDSFLTPDSLSFVELNAECPAGPAYTEVLAQLFLDLPVMRNFQSLYRVHPFKTRQLLKETLLRTYGEWVGNLPPERQASFAGRTPQVAIVDWTEVPTYSEFELCQEYFESQGMPTVIADPRELTYDGQRLRTRDGTAIDLVYKRVLTNEFIEKQDQCQA